MSESCYRCGKIRRPVLLGNSIQYYTQCGCDEIPSLDGIQFIVAALNICSVCQSNFVQTNLMHWLSFIWFCYKLVCVMYWNCSISYSAPSYYVVCLIDFNTVWLISVVRSCNGWEPTDEFYTKFLNHRLSLRWLKLIWSSRVDFFSM